MSRFQKRSNYEPPKSNLGSIIFVLGTLAAFVILFPPWESKEERSEKMIARVMKKVKEAEPDTARFIERRKEFADIKLKVLAIVKDINAFDKVLNDSFANAKSVLMELNPENKKGIINKVNRMAGEKPVKVKDDEFALVKLLANFSAKADRFDITMKPYYDQWNYDKFKRKIADTKELEKAKKLVGVDKLKLDEANKTVFLTEKGMGLDLRLVYKSLVLTMLKAAFDGAGIENYFLLIGSDAVSHGKNNEEKWQYSLQHPVKSLYRFGTVFSDNKAIAVNNIYSDAFEYKGKWYNQFLDPKTGQPATKNYTIVVLGEDPLAAKIIAISAFDEDFEKAIKNIEAWEGYEGLVMDKQGKVHLTKGMEKLVKLKEEKLY